MLRGDKIQGAICEEEDIMQITSKFTIAVHALTAIEYFKDDYTVTSSFLAGSIGVNPVIVRNIMGDLKEAEMINISQGKSGIRLAKELSAITFYDVYQAVDCVKDEGLFHFHEHPNFDCPVGRNIHAALEDKLERVQQTMEEEMKKVTLEDVAADIRKEAVKPKRKNGNERSVSRNPSP